MVAGGSPDRSAGHADRRGTRLATRSRDPSFWMKNLPHDLKRRQRQIAALLGPLDGRLVALDRHEPAARIPADLDRNVLPAATGLDPGLIEPLARHAQLGDVAGQCAREMYGTLDVKSCAAAKPGRTTAAKNEQKRACVHRQRPKCSKRPRKLRRLPHALQRVARAWRCANRPRLAGAERHGGDARGCDCGTDERLALSFTRSRGDSPTAADRDDPADSIGTAIRRNGWTAAYRRGGAAISTVPRAAGSVLRGLSEGSSACPA